MAGYHPAILFRSKEAAKTPFHVIFGKHYVATFPQVYKYEQCAINFAERNVIRYYLDAVWQLPAAKKISD